MQKAQQAIAGKTPSDAQAILKDIGITKDGVEGLYQKYGNNFQARTILAMFGTSPEKLKDQANDFMGGNINLAQPQYNNRYNTPQQPQSSRNVVAPKRYPRVK